MTTDDELRGEKLQYDINKKATKKIKVIDMSALQVKKYWPHIQED